MGRILPKLVKKETNKLLKAFDNANKRLKFSRYNFSKTHHIIESKIATYRKSKQAFKAKGERQFKTEEEV